MLTLRHVTLRYVRVENTHYRANAAVVVRRGVAASSCQVI